MFSLQRYYWKLVPNASKTDISKKVTIPPTIDPWVLVVPPNRTIDLYPLVIRPDRTILVVRTNRIIDLLPQIILFDRQVLQDQLLQGDWWALQ